MPQRRRDPKTQLLDDLRLVIERCEAAGAALELGAAPDVLRSEACLSAPREHLRVAQEYLRIATRLARELDRTYRKAGNNRVASAFVSTSKGPTIVSIQTPKDSDDPLAPRSNESKPRGESRRQIAEQLATALRETLENDGPASDLLH